MNINYSMHKFIFHYLSFFLGKFYNLLLSSAEYRYIKKIGEKYPAINTKLFHLDTYIYGDGNISIGEGSYFGKGTFIYCDPKGANIKIGKNCMISHNVHIRTLTYDAQYIHLKPKERKYKTGDIQIGDNVWIGANVFIKNGVTIGNNVIIGAGSVVTKSFSDDLIISGVPAKIIKRR
jgi:maltose O-acetyltransferase